MKMEISIEEKAKRYDEAIEKLHEIITMDNKPVNPKEIGEYLFPELKESDDEKIRKALVEMVHDTTGDSLWIDYNVHKEDALAWLEKQGEQKATIIIPKFRVGDEIKTSNEESLTVTKIDEKGYWSEDLFICGFDDAAKWQEKQDQSTIELAEDHAMLAGMEKMKEQMMANAIDVEVKVDAGGYPYIPQMELYDYDKDIPLAKKGDKYKVVLIKDE